MIVSDLVSGKLGEVRFLADHSKGYFEYANRWYKPCYWVSESGSITNNEMDVLLQKIKHKISIEHTSKMDKDFICKEVEIIFKKTKK